MDPLPDRLQATLRRRLRERQVYGVAVCGFDRTGVRFAGGVGHADLARAEPVEPTTVFRVASVSKLLTATLLLRLVEAGEVGLDDPVNDHLPDELVILDPDEQPASSSVRSLLSHSSGLPYGLRGADLGNRLLSRVANQGEVTTLADAIEGLRATHPPGTKIVYSNPAYNVLGHVAAARLDRSFEAASRSHVLQPLGMSDSAFGHRIGPGVATPYGSLFPPGVSDRPVDRMRLVATPMGGLTTTVLDLARFGQMVLGAGEVDGRRFLESETLATATATHIRNHPGLEQGYGLGFKTRRWRGRELVGHDGNMPGVATQLLVSPSDGVGAVVLTNGFALGIPHETTIAVLEQLIGLDPDLGAPTDVPASQRHARVQFGRRLEGTPRLLDASPPGLAGSVVERGTKVRVSHEVAGRLRVGGMPGWDGPVWLMPEGEPGHYRVRAAVDDGSNAVIEERGDGFHAWLGYTTHLHWR